MKLTHNERVLALLSDGKPHSHLEIYQLHVVAHSRISDLRKQGHHIDMWREGDLYLYRLRLNEPGIPAARVSLPHPPRLVEARCAASPESSNPPSSGDSGQLFLLDPYSRRVA